MAERHLIRILVAIALCLALLAYVRAPVPMNAQGDPALPTPAFEQVALYRLEIALLAFYGCLLLVTPALSGLLRGRLPIEISTRGARFAEEADQSAEGTKAAIRDLERTVMSLSDDLTAANLKLRRLDASPYRDSTQPRVDSKQ